MNNSTPPFEKTFRYNAQHWFGKCSAAFILGFFLSLGISGIILNFGFDQVEIFSTESQFLMWLISPVWIFVVSFGFLFRSTLTAWVYLSGANILVWAPILVDALLLS